MHQREFGIYFKFRRLFPTEFLVFDMRINNVMNRIILLLFVLLGSWGCAREIIPQSLASIDQSENWKIEPICGYEGCYPLVDTLVGNDLRIRFDIFNNQYYQIRNPFSIVLTFSMPQSYQCTFSPFSTQLQIDGNKIISATKFVDPGNEEIHSSYYTQKTLKLSGEGKPIEGIIYQAVSIGFPTYTPTPEKTFKLFLNGLVCNGKTMQIPVVTFSEGMREW